MKQFLFAHSANQSASQLLDECLEQLGDIPPEATLGFLYATDHLAEQIPGLLQNLRETTGIQHWVGT
ncbi:MAG TPA: hypothetical protein VIQ03_14015, partial [Gammaproteobacteria bacterium]